MEKKKARNCGRSERKIPTRKEQSESSSMSEKTSFLSETNAERSIRVPRSDAARHTDLAGKG